MKSNFTFVRSFLASSMIAVILGVFCTIPVFAGKYDLLLRSGTVKLEPNLETFIQDPGVPSSDVFGNSYYRLVQFSEIPNGSVRSELKANGIRLMSYIPNFAYLAEIHVNANISALKDAGVRSILPVLPEWKISPSIAGNELPIHALVGDDRIDLVIKYYDGSPINAVVSSLQSDGYQILSQYDAGNQLTVRALIEDIETLAGLSYISIVEPVLPPSEPDDTRGRSLHRSNTINTEQVMGRKYDGTGVSAALADDGLVGPHIDFTGRLDQANASGFGPSHGDMTAGILGGAGNLDPNIEGMAAGTFIYIYDIGGYNHIVNSPNTHQNLGVMVTSTSYSQGCNDYNAFSEDGDRILHENPNLLHVYSAGNNAGANCGYGAGSGWGNITGGYKVGKNVIACANLDYIGIRTTSSSRGPAPDGRVKPDISANGTGQLSTDENNTYQTGGGTSAACPGIAGIVSQLQHAHRDLNGGADAAGALIKACLFNTAEDYGNAGPDYSFGWGRVNSYRAVLTMEENRYMLDSIDQGGTNTHNITVPANTAQIRVMIHWTDVEGNPVAAKALVNDLNMTLTDPNSMTYNPWVLDHTPNVTALTTPATRGLDSLNNSEQVTLDNPPAGIYTVEVNGNVIPQGPQNYYLVYEFINDEIEVTYPIGGEGFVPGETETIRWDGYDNTGSYTLEYTEDDGATWTQISNTVAGTVRHYDWSVPGTLSGEVRVRVTKGTQSDESDENLTIIGLPTNIQVDWVCPDSLRLVWTGVTGALGYEASLLGPLYMDSVGYTTTTDLIIPISNPSLERWASVKAYAPNGNKGRRANAIQIASGVFNCPIAIDASLVQVFSPAGGILQDCMDLSAIDVSIELENNGQNPLTNIPVAYTLNGGTPVAETYSGTLNPNQTVTYTFTNPLNLQAAGTYDLKLWADYPSDGNHYNDTSEVSVEVIAGTLQTLPYSEDFEGFTLCPTTNNCEQTSCTMANGWINEPNGIRDDIDFRTNEGGTPSNNTGPNIDHNPGTTTGNYIYTEASFCFNREAVIISPCFDLTTSVGPEFEFWYHMFGQNMGTLHVDVLFNDVWQLDVIPAISGNQGNSWQQAVVNLSPFTGDIINIRFRGETGPNFTSDIAIDDVSVYEVQAPPVPAFTATETNLCVGQETTLLDMSQNSPTTWDWQLTPSTGFNYVNGTTSSSQNPQLEFTTAGIYDVELTVTNPFGNSSTTINSYITVGVHATTPLVETFQPVAFPPADWALENADGGTTWERRTGITGSGGTNTEAAWMDNFTYNAAGQEDGIITEKVDLTNATNPVMTFDVAYVPFSAAFWDGLRVDISLDCGSTYNPTGYYKENTVLATGPASNGNWDPTAAGDWRNDTIDLSTYVGSVIMIKFVNVNGYGNSLFIDNVNFDEIPVGLNEVSGNQVINLYPNPSSGVMYLQLSEVQEKTAVLTITDIRGRIVLRESLEQVDQIDEYIIDLAGQEQGLYQVELRTSGTVYSGKVSVIR